MQLDLELILVGGVVLFGLVILYYALFNRKETQKNEEDPILLDFSKSFLPWFVVILVLRSFVAEPFRIPSGSMIPTLEVGDFILVKKYAYALKMPITNSKLIDISSPERGDVVVFRYPIDPKKHYIKRVIGLPGDQIEWSSEKKLTINNQLVKEIPVDDYRFKDRGGNELVVNQRTEFLTTERSHQTIQFPVEAKPNKWIVPEGHYFMMGDNRDRSKDSRSWGFVPKDNLIGKASLVWMHWNWFDNGDGFQSGRIGTSIN